MKQTNNPASSSGNQSVNLSQLLGSLFVIQVVSLAGTLLGMAPALIDLTGWLLRLTGLGTAVILFQLGPVNPRYQIAAICQAVSVIGGALAYFAPGMLVLNLVRIGAGICSIVALFEEYYGHGELVAERDARLSGHWRALFIWELVVSLLSGVVTAFIVVVGVMAEIDALTLTTVSVAVVAFAGGVVQIFYLLYLKRTRELIG